MLAAQGGVCAICGASPDNSFKGVLHVDHNHKTGKVRGLLCGMCNVALGNFRDDPNLALAGAVYLEQRSSR